MNATHATYFQRGHLSNLSPLSNQASFITGFWSNTEAEADVDVNANALDEHTPCMQNIRINCMGTKLVAYMHGRLFQRAQYPGLLNKRRICKQCDIERLISK